MNRIISPHQDCLSISTSHHHHFVQSTPHVVTNFTPPIYSAGCHCDTLRGGRIASNCRLTVTMRAKLFFFWVIVRPVRPWGLGFNKPIYCAEGAGTCRKCAQWNWGDTVIVLSVCYSCCVLRQSYFCWNLRKDKEELLHQWCRLNALDTYFAYIVLGWMIAWSCVAFRATKFTRLDSHTKNIQKLHNILRTE